MKDEKNFETKEKSRKTILELLLYNFPMQLANRFGIEPYEVFAVIDSLDEKQKRQLQRERLKKRPFIYIKVKSEMEKRKISAKGALSIIERTINNGKAGQLAEVYYILGEPLKSERVINSAIKSTSSESLKKSLEKQLESLKIEQKAEAVRKCGKQKGMSNSEIAMQAGVTESFVIRVLGTRKLNLDR